ncbi:hypothetical protein WHR41_08447 [Cladosporium halotolerans]|uniref:Enolase-phosphatase E1 n=1 Tax=Cladosporium halotolerans TaxID=1052096 RepID=A0AB34KD50_9PEZI
MSRIEVQGVKCVLLDIEGTICPISFVKETLFPYALRALPTILSTHWTSPSLAPYIAAFPPEHRTSPAALESHVRDLTARDVKAPYHKALQGYLWEEGYASGAYATELFADVVPALRGWKEGGRGVAIYSSGSVFAQKLLMRHVRGSDGRVESLEGLVGEEEKGWFDTVNAGSKVEEASYGKIAGVLELAPESILFLSDNVKEVEAALSAGMKSLVVDRPGNAPLSDEDKNRFKVIESFEQISLA